MRFVESHDFISITLLLQASPFISRFSCSILSFKLSGAAFDEFIPLNYCWAGFWLFHFVSDDFLLFDGHEIHENNIRWKCAPSYTNVLKSVILTGWLLVRKANQFIFSMYAVCWVEIMTLFHPLQCTVINLGLIWGKITKMGTRVYCGFNTD